MQDLALRVGDILCVVADTLQPRSIDELILHAPIWIDPARCGGRPCIRGHRIWVSMVVDLLADGLTPQEIIGSHYPQITVQDIHACIACGSAMSRERFVPVAFEPVA